MRDAYNSLHPGVIATGLTRSWPAWARTLYPVFMPAPVRGARTSIYLASSPEVATVNGQYFDQNSCTAEPAPLARDPLLARQLWEVSEDLVGLGMLVI